MNVLLVCHAFGPEHGSEPGYGWNWAWYLSREHDIWVLVHPEFRADVEAYISRHPNPRLHVVWLKATSWDPRQGQSGVGWHYLRWLRQAERLGRSLHAKVGFDLVHHISISSISAPPGWWKLGVPSIWGPLGGAQTCPAQLVELFGSRRWIERLRPLRLGLLRLYPPFRKAIARSSALLATNLETQQFLLSAGATDVPLFWDSGVVDQTLPDRPVWRPQPQTVRVLWASRFQKRKALPLALDALARHPHAVPLQLVVAGTGPERDAWMTYAGTLGLDNCVEFVGELDPRQMREEFRRADMFLFTSVRDSCASVVLEAMTHGVPVVTLNLHGVGAYMPDGAGIKIVPGSRTATVDGLAGALQRLAADPDLRHAMGTHGWEYASHQIWSRRAAQMSALYRRVGSPPAGRVAPGPQRAAAQS